MGGTHSMHGEERMHTKFSS